MKHIHFYKFLRYGYITVKKEDLIAIKKGYIYKCLYDNSYKVF